MITKKWLSTVQTVIGGIGALLLMGAAAFAFARPKEIPVVEAFDPKEALPKKAFAQPKAAYEAIDGHLLALKFSPARLQLPDLRKSLIFYGKNGRPDIQLDRPVLFFAFSGNKFPTPISPGEKQYLLYDRSVSPAQYIFSPDNQETPLWLEADLKDNAAHIKVGMKDEQQELVQEPLAHAQFSLPEKEYVRIASNSSWEIGKWRVDGSLLARQKARWYGVDCFMQIHGGEEYQNLIGKERLDFAENEEVYSIYVTVGDTIVWDDEGRWKVVIPGPYSLGRPLLVVKKIDERLMNFELWDAEGKSKLVLNLLKSNEAWAPDALEQNFKFVGARTRSQFVFEVNKERMLLSPQDWLVLTESGWQKLTTPEEIDEYVNRKLRGPLFVFDGITRKDDHQILVGKMYSASRTDMQEVELPVHVISGHKERSRIKEGANHGVTPVAKSK